MKERRSPGRFHKILFTLPPDLSSIQLPRIRAANHYIFPTNRMEVHTGKYISVVATRTRRCNGRVGMGDRLQASIVDTARYNRLLPITSNMSSRADDEESSIILQNKMVRVQRPGEHTTAMPA